VLNLPAASKAICRPYFIFTLLVLPYTKKKETMNLLYRIILSAIVAAGTAAILNAVTAAQDNGLVIDPTSFVVIFIGCVIIALVSPAIKATTSTSASKSAPKAKKGKPSGKGREQGEVKWFNVSKGYGFVTRSTGEDIFVHFRSIRGEGRRVLREGQQVEFTVTDGDKGPQAEDVDTVD
jgi:CspA family cold shock protein